MGNTASVAGRDCFMAAVGGDPNLAAFRGDLLYEFRALPSYNLAIPVIPEVITYPKNTTQVAEIVRCAVEEKYRVQAYSGGHSYGNYGLGGTDGHVVIDLKNFQQFSMDPDTHIATVGAGTNLGDLQNRLLHAGGRAMAHGSCPQVGVGGHFTIGGLGLMSRQWGTSLDHVVEAEVVLANSSVVTASDTQNQDIFWAIKGAAASFGIVTQFKVRTHEVPKAAIQYTYTFSQGDILDKVKLFQAWQSLVAKPNITRNFSTELTIFQDGIVIMGSFLGTREEFQEFQHENGLPIESMGNVAYITNWLALVANSAENYLISLAGGLLTSFYSKSLSFTADQMFTERDLVTFFTYLDTAPKGTQTWWVIFDMEGGAINDVPMNATSFVHRDAVMWMQSYSVVGFEPPGFIARRFLNRLHQVVLENRPAGPMRAYPGYVDPYLKNGQMAYWGSNLERLQSIKTLVDPRDIFHNPQSVPVNPITNRRDLQLQDV
ncbi:FAD linked oxidase N-terminal [Penicillium paradoxum]|uniref:FAD linked oxidase N-terminal n=1 Tax=Penicillium paradoxum TaxID=176176 RepID=UPI0025477759|nr:FAD linked oxidase N-terminal [Penicillium paradoxum]KAJ5788266.1 FAD linked oxidase N-terminal [Penicillium paradoxum]